MNAMLPPAILLVKSITQSIETKKEANIVQQIISIPGAIL